MHGRKVGSVQKKDRNALVSISKSLSIKVCFYDRSDADLKTGYAKKKKFEVCSRSPPVAATKPGHGEREGPLCEIFVNV